MTNNMIKLNKVLILFISTTLLFMSCSHKKVHISSDLNTNTIKDVFIQKNNEIIWVDELEPEKLSEKFSFDEKLIAKEVERSPLMVITENISDNKVYPSLDGFTNLDISSMNSSLKKTINDFCESFQHKNIFTNVSKFFNSKFSFNAVLFTEDFKLSYEKNVGKFPYKADSNDENINLFNSYLLGKPEISLDFYEIPVRFYCQTKFVDLTLKIKDSVPYEIYDINIIGWEND